MGGMDYINKLYDGEIEGDDEFNVEAPAYDYAGIIAAASSGDGASQVVQPRKNVVIRKKEKKAAEGGC